MTFPRHRLTSKQRQALYESESAKALASGRGEHPICNICNLPVQPGQEWHDSHNKYLPHAAGGERDGIAHARCNLKHNNEHDTPLVAKLKRIAQKHSGAYRSANPMRGSRDHPWQEKQKLNGTVVRR